MRLSLAAVATAGSAAAVAAYCRRRPGDDLAGEVALVTGASRGLGLLIATELAGRGCRLLLCARDSAELERAADRLRSAGAEVDAVACDITRQESAGQLVDAARERYGRLDILVNNAGIIRVGPVQSTSPTDYEAALATMAMAPVRLALAALPVMRTQGHGRIVTITSIGGKLSVPHLLPYSTAKFAAVGFSEGLRAELGSGPVTVTTVVPGLMRTGSPVQASFHGDAAREYRWFALGDVTSLTSMSGPRAARQIVHALERGATEVTLSWQAKLLRLGHALLPGTTIRLLGLIDRLLPEANDGATRRGADLELPPSIAALLRPATVQGRQPIIPR